jgi:hypothetical protein
MMGRSHSSTTQLLIYGIWTEGAAVVLGGTGMLTALITWTAVVCGLVLIVCSKRVPLRVRVRPLSDHEYRELRRLRRQKHEWQEQKQELEYDRSLHMDDRIALPEASTPVGDVRASVERKATINGYLRTNDELIEQSTAWGFPQLATLGAQLNVAWYCELAAMGVDVCAMLGIEAPGEPVKVQRSLWEVPILTPEVAQERAVRHVQGLATLALSVPPTDVSEPERLGRECGICGVPLHPRDAKEELDGSMTELWVCPEEPEHHKLLVHHRLPEPDKTEELEAENRKLQRQLSAMRVSLTDARREMERARVDAQVAAQQVITNALNNRVPRTFDEAHAAAYEYRRPPYTIGLPLL